MSTPSATFHNKPSSITTVLFQPPLSNNAASWLCTATLIGLFLVVGLRDNPALSLDEQGEYYLDLLPLYGSSGKFQNTACDEIYVVREGETLHTISDKCGDPFIIERNPHIHDPDDVFPGLVLHITPYWDGKSF